MSPFFFFQEPLTSFSPCDTTHFIFIGLIKFFRHVNAWVDTKKINVVFTDCWGKGIIRGFALARHLYATIQFLLLKSFPVYKKPYSISYMWAIFISNWGGTTMMKSSCDHTLRVWSSPFSSPDIVSQNCNLIHVMTTPPQSSSPKQTTDLQLPHWQSLNSVSTLRVNMRIILIEEKTRCVENMINVSLWFWLKGSNAWEWTWRYDRTMMPVLFMAFCTGLHWTWQIIHKKQAYETTSEALKQGNLKCWKQHL